jgi:hypothetical protein
VKRVSPSEYQIQAAFFQWRDAQKAKIPELKRLYAVENGGYRHKATAGRLKASGVTRGIPDVFLAVSSGAYHGLYIEFKSETGRQSPEQKLWESSCVEYGYQYALVRSTDEAIDVTLKYIERRSDWHSALTKDNVLHPPPLETPKSILEPIPSDCEGANETTSPVKVKRQRRRRRPRVMANNSEITNGDVVRFVKWTLEYKSGYCRAHNRAAAAALDINEVTVSRITNADHINQRASDYLLSALVKFCGKEGITLDVAAETIGKWQKEAM